MSLVPIITAIKRMQERTQLFYAYRTRVLLDGGVIYDAANKDLYKILNDNKKYNVALSWNSLGGYKPRVSGLYNYCTKAYDSSANVRDLVQATALNQPPLQAIAPTEKPYLINPNGGVNFMTHPTISFGAGDAWTVETVVNWNGDFNTSNCIAGTTNTAIRVNLSTTPISNSFQFVSEDLVGSAPIASSNILIGKSSVLHFVANNGTLSIYINGQLLQSIATKTLASFNYFGLGRGSTIKSKLYHHSIFSQALTPSQISSRYTLLRSIFPKVETVPIGTQNWTIRNYEAVCTPQDNLIQEMQPNGNVEKIVNGGFDTDTNWIKNGSSIISSGKAIILNGSIYQVSLTSNSINKWYKYSFEVTNYVIGCDVFLVQNAPILINGNGVYSGYKYCSSVGNGRIIDVYNTNANFTLDNVSIQEIGWSGSQELYDGIYAQTAGTVEQKTYAAVKAAAMWGHYNNDPQLGIIYGKLYNWFAVKLLQMDIDYYNTANPTTPWGYRVPTDADFNTLATTLGGASVAGGKMKMIGTSYWNSPNTGATNESGFSALAGGARETNVFKYLNTRNHNWSITESAVSGYSFELGSADVASGGGNRIKTDGGSIRLIKN